MIGTLKYTEVESYINSLNASVNNLRTILNKYDKNKVSRVLEFCNTLDSYSRYLTSTVQLFKDSDEALKVIIEKNS